MITGRRIAAALLTAALSLGIAGTVGTPAQAKDTTWPTGRVGISPTDTTWPTLSDTTWPTH